MTATAAPFGMRPIRQQGGFANARAYTIASAYNTNIFRGSPVILNTNGTIVIGTGAADIIGAFAGVEYTDTATGRRMVSDMWPANQVATDIVAYVYDDPDTEFEMQGAGSYAATAVGDQADFTNPGNGSTVTQLSSCSLGALVGVGVQGQMRITGLAPYVDNVWGDAFTIVRCRIARHQYVGNKVAV